MAAFASSTQHHPFHLDSVLLQNSHPTINTNNNMSCYNNLPHIIANNNNDHSLLLNTMDSSSIVTDKFDSSSENLLKKRKCKLPNSSPNSAQSKDKRSEVKEKKQKKIKEIEEKKSGEEGPKGYIHVRARRGQATDSHSLAERMRRERISERMKLLQALVPGCDKVTGKALMLDEIINYVQSLQNQVEFLSMKLASVNPMFYDFGMDLESFMVRPDQDLNNLGSSMQECIPTASNNYHLLQNSANSILFQQPQIPSVQLPLQPQGLSRQSLWEVDDEHRQKNVNQLSSGFNTNTNTNTNTLFSFH